MPRVPGRPYQRLGEGPAPQGAREGCREKAAEAPPASFQALAVTAQLRGAAQQHSGSTAQSWAGPSWKRQGGSGRFCSSAGPGAGPDLSLRPRAQPSLPVMCAGAMGLTHMEGHRMGSEPFQFTDAPFHLRAEEQRMS